MERNLEHVHVVIYSKKMLKEAIKRLIKHEQNIETDIICEFEFHGNDLLVCENGLFKVVNGIMEHPNHEVTLNDLCEMIIDQEDRKLKIDDWAFIQLKGNEHLGFSVQKLIFESTVKYHNQTNCPHSAIKISSETVERLRKDALCLK